jgi:hypothetical protein
MPKVELFVHKNKVTSHYLFLLHHHLCRFRNLVHLSHHCLSRFALMVTGTVTALSCSAIAGTLTTDAMSGGRRPDRVVIHCSDIPVFA